MDSLELEGRLQLEVNEERLTLAAEGCEAVITLPSARCGLRIYRSLPRARTMAISTSAIAMLSKADLTIRLCVGPRTLISAGPGLRPSRILNALGLPPVTVHWAALLRSLLAN